MKVKVGKSVKSNSEFHYYEIESDDVPLANLENTRAWLEKIVTGWLNQAIPKQSSNGEVGNHIETPKKGSGICKDCGCKIDPRYKSCFKCYSKHKQ